MATQPPTEPRREPPEGNAGGLSRVAWGVKGERTADAEGAARRSFALPVILSLLTLVLLAAGIAGLWSLYRRFAGGDEPSAVAAAGPAPVEPIELTVPQAPEPPPMDREARRERMRRRYRPGPFVEVVGLLPGGTSDLRRMAAAHRGGRTIDNPWLVVGAELRAGSPPIDPGPGGPGLRLTESSSAPLTVVPGAPALIPIAASSGAGDDGAVAGLLLEFVDYPGFFVLPAVVESELGTIRVAGVEEAEIQLGIDAPVLPGGRPAPPDKEMYATVRIASVDTAGRTSGWVERRLRVMPTGIGDVEVSLSMTESTDLDLYVVSPTGVVVYYGNTDAATGGHLDLDANAACSSNMGTDNEHIFWPRRRAPAGTYQVRVAHWRSCIGGRPVHYRITVRNCGETAVFSGSFTGEGNSDTCDRDPSGAGDRNWCQRVVDFDVTPCESQP